MSIATRLTGINIFSRRKISFNIMGIDHNVFNRGGSNPDMGKTPRNPQIRLALTKIKNFIMKSCSEVFMVGIRFYGNEKNESMESICWSCRHKGYCISEFKNSLMLKYCGRKDM